MKKNKIARKKPGPVQVLPEETEKDIRDWVVAMQRKGFPVSCEMILCKANEVYREIYGKTRSVGFLDRGWMDRFMQRHPLLTFCSSQVIRRVRAEAMEEGLKIFIWDLMKHVVERNLTPERVFNMDETGFAQKSRNKRVIAVHGSKNVWSKSVEANFHLTNVASVGASGYVVPPLFIMPGSRVNRDVMDSCEIPGSTISTAAKGFINSSLFLRWLDHFSINVPDSIKRLIVLVYYGYGSHYSEEIVTRAIELKIIFVLLPPNSTHLIQPLDIAVFRPFKTILKRKLEQFMIQKAITSFSKRDSIKIASSAWIEGVVQKKEKVIAGFKAGGIWPVSYPAMQKRWIMYHNGGCYEGRNTH